MTGRRHREIPASLVRGRARFEAWRRYRKLGARIPDELWSLAVTLADEQGLSRTASVLGLDYYSLRQRVAARKSGSTSEPSAFVEAPASSDSALADSALADSASADSASARPAFIELSSLQVPLPGVPGECVVEFEDGVGARLRVHLRGCDVPDVVALGRSFWSGE